MTTLLVAALVAWATGPTRAVPAPDEVLSTSPDELRLVFEAPVEEAEIRLYGPDGAPIDLPPPTVDGETVVVAPPELGEAGRYLVAWRATAGPSVERGAHFFAFDPTGEGSLDVQRAVRGDPVTAAGFTLAGLAALAVAAWAAAGSRPDGLAAGAAGLLAVAAAAQRWGPEATAPFRGAWGGGWLLAASGAVAVVGVLVAWGGSAALPGRAITLGGIVLAGVGIAWAGTSHAVTPWLVPLGLLATGAGGALAARRRGAALVAVAGLALVLGGFWSRPADAEIVVVRAGDLRVEASVDPARRGRNELHLYAYRDGGGIARLDDATAVAWNHTEDIGPLELPLLRAGPHHFLTYTADLTVPGRWTVRFEAETESGGRLVAEVEVDAE